MTSDPNKPIDYGKVSDSFGHPHPIRPGACPRCGAIPPCEVPKPKEAKP